MRSVCVFCGSREGERPTYRDAAARLAGELARRGATLVFGGGRVGLMGVLADTVLAAGGEAIGVMPRGLVEREIAHLRLTRLHVVGTMHERKQLMADLADAFVLLPGGFGSWDEFCEVVTWVQLGIHAKPCGILNVDDYYAPLLAQIERAVGEGFIGSPQAGALIVDREPESLLARLAAR
jgi:uncharacterized protein (TIGR00730 family)